MSQDNIDLEKDGWKIHHVDLIKSGGCLKAQVTVMPPKIVPYYQNYFKVMEKDGKIWVTNPQISFKENGQIKYRKIISPIGTHGKKHEKELHDMIIEAYWKTKNEYDLKIDEDREVDIDYDKLESMVE